MNASKLKFIALALCLLLILVASQALAQGQSGTTLTADVSASGYWNRTVDYDWSVSKTASTASILLDGDSASANVGFTVEVTRWVASDVTVAGVSGQVCVTNGGDVATEGLAITLVIQANAGGFYDLTSFGVDLSANPVLDPGETGCYSYNFQFSPVATTQYRVSALVTITNHSGSLGIPKGPNPKADFNLPAEPVLVELDATAVLTDLFTCPLGFSCTLSDTGPWFFNGSGTVNLTLEVINEGVCGFEGVISNTAYLLASNGEAHNSTANVTVYTGDCPETDQWCSPGYWRNHFDAWAATGISPDALYSSYFGLPTLSRQGQRSSAPANPTLWEVVTHPEWYGGEAFNNVGDLLSSAHPEVNFSGTRVEDSCPLN